VKERFISPIHLTGSGLGVGVGQPRHGRLVFDTPFGELIFANWETFTTFVNEPQAGWDSYGTVSINGDQMQHRKIIVRPDAKLEFAVMSIEKIGRFRGKLHYAVTFRYFDAGNQDTPAVIAISEAFNHKVDAIKEVERLAALATIRLCPHVDET